MRATGFPSFQYGVLTTVDGGAGAPFVYHEGGEVSGTNELSGDRESSWDTSEPDFAIAQFWASLKGAKHNTDVNFESDFFGTIGDVATFIGTLAGGALVGGPVGVCFVLGIHGADAIGLDEEVGTAGLVGVAVASGVLVVFGPSAIVAAIVAGAAAGAAVELLLKHRKLTERPAEVQFANRVFQGTLPVDRIVLTNMLGLGGRPFTMPSVGDTILVNMGKGFDDPINYRGNGDDEPQDQAPGHLFIHELVHAWQIDATHFLPGLMCNAVLNQSTTLGGDMGVYDYGEATRAFGQFNLEQQAKIVEHWFAPGGRMQKRPAENEASPYFRYIRDNIRKRIP